MAINPKSLFPTKFGTVSAAWPYGEPQNITVPGDGTGSPWEVNVVKDIMAVQQGLLKAAGDVAPSGTPDAVGSSQYIQALIELMSGRAFQYVGSGPVNAYIATPPTNIPAPVAYFSGFTIEVDVGVTNTGAATINAGSLGVVSVLDSDGGALVGGELVAGRTSKLRYDGAAFRLQNQFELKTKVIEIGEWNMDTTVSVTVAHGLTLNTIRSVSVIIRDDNDSVYQEFSSSFDVAGTSNSAVQINATNIIILRQNGGFFDSTSFDTMSGDGNRGWITIQYV